MRRLRVSSFLAEVTQHIHSLRANGVMLAHAAVTSASDSIALRKSTGILCTVPEAIACRAMVSTSLPGIDRSASSERGLVSEGCFGSTWFVDRSNASGDSKGLRYSTAAPVQTQYWLVAR
jgi:hypothetical protein